MKSRIILACVWIQDPGFKWRICNAGFYPGAGRGAEADRKKRLKNS